MGCFGILALSHSLLGIYGVVNQLVNERRRKIGVRLAFGARHREVFACILRSSLFLVAIGVAIGVAMSLALTKLISSVEDTAAA